MALSGKTPPKIKKSGASNQEFKFPPKQYSFKDDQVVTIFHFLQKDNKLKLPKVRHPNEVGRIIDPNYCLFHRMVHYPTNKCFVLKDKIQALINTGVLTLKSEMKKVTENMVTLEFGNFSKVTVLDRHAGAPKARLEVINSLTKQQEAKGLIQMTIKSKEIMWVHLDLANDEQ